MLSQILMAALLLSAVFAAFAPQEILGEQDAAELPEGTICRPSEIAYTVTCILPDGKEIMLMD